MFTRVMQIALLVLILVVGCQPPEEMDWDAIKGSIVDDEGVGLGSVKVVTSYPRWSQDFDYSADYRNFYDSTYTEADGSYVLANGFPVDLMLESSWFGCSSPDDNVVSARNETFVLSFISVDIDTYSVLIIDTSGYWRNYFPDADTNNIDRVLLGSNAMYGEPGTIRTIPELNLDR